MGKARTKKPVKKAAPKKAGNAAKRTAPKPAKKVAKKSATAKRTPKHAAPPQQPDRVVPHLVVHDGAAAMEFYKKAFGGEELERMNTPDGRLMHGEVRIAGHRIFVSDEFELAHGGTLKSPRTLGGTGTRLMLEVADADAAAAQAVAAGATELMPVQDMFWGARYGKLLDPFGHEWALNQQKRQLSSEENQAATAAFLKESRNKA